VRISESLGKPAVYASQDEPVTALFTMW
jgi:hypothetical protein